MTATETDPETQASSGMYALTIWQPWADAIARGTKDVENRPWPAPRAAIGQDIAIHAGLRSDPAASPPRGLTLPTWYDPPGHALVRGAIVAVAHLSGCHHHSQCTPLCSPWADGPWHWQLARRHALATPVPVRGARRLWKLQPATTAAVAAQAIARSPEDADLDAILHRAMDSMLAKLEARFDPQAGLADIYARARARNQDRGGHRPADPRARPAPARPPAEGDSSSQ
ncbi:MAG TPA: ASCH domain-containing protein [Streptosporangiaceae bacterium]|jgi:hypothetical protein